MKFKGIDFSTITDDEALFFIRIRGKKSYFNMVYTDAFLKQFSSLKEFRCISEYKKDASEHIDLNSVGRDYLREDEYLDFIEHFDMEGLIRRCRALRGISFDRAKAMVYRAYLFFEQFYKSRPQLKLIVTGAVDNYIMDMMETIGKKYGVVFVGVTDSFMSPEYKLVTVRGEESHFFSPTDSDIDKMFDKINGTELSPIIPKRSKAIKAAAYDLGSYIYRFSVRYLIKYHMLGRLEYEYQFAPLLKKFNSIDQLLATRYLKNKEELDLNSDCKYAYIPLHFYPEATTDYWMDDLFHVDYLNSVLDTIEKLKEQGFEILVKEHPAYYPGRTSSFYKKIKSTGATIVSPFISTKEIFDMVDLIVVWNGSTGIEAIVHGKPIVKVTNSYYGDEIIPGLEQAEELPVVSKEEGKRVVQKVLESSCRTL